MKRHRRAWIDSELNKVRALRRAGLGYKEIGYIVGRSPKATQHALLKGKVTKRICEPIRPSHVTAQYNSPAWDAQCRQSCQEFIEAARKHYPQYETPPDANGHYARPACFDSLGRMPKRINANRSSVVSSLTAEGTVTIW